MTGWVNGVSGTGECIQGETRSAGELGRSDGGKADGYMCVYVCVCLRGRERLQ